MNKTRVFNYIKKRYKLLFCYLLILLGVLLTVIVLVIRPIKLINNYVYSQSKETAVSEVIFPLEQKININHNKLSSIWIHFENDSINDYIYEIEVRNSKDEVYFEHVYDGYESNIINIGLGMIEYSEGETLTLKIDCDECQDVSMAKGEVIDDSYIVGDDDNSLKIYYQYYAYNNTFYWYSILSIVLGVILIPFAKENCDE